MQRTALRRPLFTSLVTSISAALLLTGGSALAQAQAQPAPGAKIKVGFMLPYTGTYAALGSAIENGFRMYVQQQGGKLGGRDIEYFKVDDESDPAKAPENATKLIKRDQVDVVVGTVHSGVQMGIVKVAKENNTLLIIPNAGADEATGPLCGANIFRSSFSNWQPGYAMGQVLAERGMKKVVTLTWKYAAGEQSVKGFKEAFEAKGGKVVKELSLPFPNVEFQALITEVASLKPDVIKAMEAAKVDSPRGVFTLSKAHNPVQDFYLRKVDGRENKVSGVAVKALADPARGCRL